MQQYSRSSRFRLSVSALLASVLTAAVLAPGLQADEITSEAIEQVLEKYRSSNDVPALGGAVVRVGQPTVIGVVGVRKRGDETKVEPGDKFHLGSCSKAMTGMLIARLVEQGKLKWDDPLPKLFPDLADEITPQLRGVTLAHLLAHQSTLKELKQSNYWKLSEKSKPAAQRLAAVKEALVQDSDKAPGESFEYANINYIVAASAAEQATGQDWETLIQTEVFQPLKMASAGYGSMATPGKVDQPWSHYGDGKPIEPGPYGDNPTVMGPAGRVHCSLEDWGKFVAEHLQSGKAESSLLKTESYRLLHTPEFKGSGYTRGGWGTPNTPWGKALSHDGSNTLNYSTAMLIPDKGLAILVVCNQGDTQKGGAVACQQARGALLKLALGSQE